MPDIIRLLPENVANQIAAGEVVQRPASAVKELLENSVDAGASAIKLTVKDAGKTLIHVIDNGTGLSETDARMAFERHATSKISRAEDIFAIHTKGFRGEALASIAAVAQVELKSRRESDELGTCLKIEGSKVLEQQFCQTPRGTQILVKNLFFNIPARRNFLKSDAVELRHIIDEFERVALAHPHIAFEMTHNGGELFKLPEANLRQRIVNVFGKRFNEKLVPVEEQTEIVNISGYVGKPEYAKKTRGEQFFFTNHRFIRNGYLHKAVCNAFDRLLQEGQHPSYFLYLELDPARIDVNIHPTKTEIKFDDDRAIHTILYTAVKHALGQFNIAPAMDFENDLPYEGPPPKSPPPPPGLWIDPDFNPFAERPPKEPAPRPAGQPGAPPSRGEQNWEVFMSNLPEVNSGKEQQQNLLDEESTPRKNFIQIGGKYLLTNHGEGMILIHQQRAHEQILTERICQTLEHQQAASQQLLFPQNIDFSTGDFATLREMMPRLRQLGFDLDEFGQSEIVVNGIPLFLSLLEWEKDAQEQSAQQWHQKMAGLLARVAAVKSGTKLSTTEMQQMTDELFGCQSPYFTHQGKPIVVNLQLSDIDKSFH